MKYLNRDKTSMLYWWPKIKHLDIPMPKTEIVKVSLTIKNLHEICDGDFTSLKPYWTQLIMSSKKIGFPLFMRTDHFSGKHSWKKTCYVKNKRDLKSYMREIVEMGLLVDIIGLPVNAFVFREYILMKNLFTAFYGNMPVNPEIRFFIDKRKIKCWYWYWIKEAIHNPSIDNWEEIIDETKNKIVISEIKLLRYYSRKVAKILNGYWSIDFCKSKNGKWYLIDMAEGEISWHPKCKKNLQ